MKKLNSEGEGKVVKQAEPISPLEEEKLWETDVFANTSKSQTQDAIVKVLREYMESIPLGGLFYRRPLSSRDGENVRYSHQKVGVHTFEKLFKKICDKADITGHHTGHSGKVTTATRLFHNKVDEQLVQERTGHRSLAVRAYKRTSKTQQKKISDLLQPPKPKESKIEPKTSPPRSPVATCTLPD
ncbi:uncharacterized protein [Haliotis cracherodii]|uniref:uncharacterized protein n=1 Tax=Haliotis cracherodii TaxID=6455 RepID=UPI0039EC7A56